MITKNELDNLVTKYETPDFIKDDPIIFSHKFSAKKTLKLRDLSLLLLHTDNDRFLSKNLTRFY